MSGKKSLVVDDDPSVRKFIKAVLQNNGFQISEAENGVQALELLRKLSGAVDLLVSDIKMPLMDGIALACSVRNEFPAIPIILVSGYTAAGHAPCADYEFLQKPFFPATLLAVVNRVLMTETRSPSAEPRAMSATGGAE